MSVLMTLRLLWRRKTSSKVFHAKKKISCYSQIVLNFLLFEDLIGKPYTISHRLFKVSYFPVRFTICTSPVIHLVYHSPPPPPPPPPFHFSWVLQSSQEKLKTMLKENVFSFLFFIWEMCKWRIVECRSLGSKGRHLNPKWWERSGNRAN